MAFDHRTQIVDGDNPSLKVTSTNVASDQGLDVFIINSSIPFVLSGLLAEDHGYGAVGADTLRTAAQIGNATGAADFGAGAVGAQTLRITLGSTDPAVVALQILDDWDESDRAKVNPIVGQAGVAAGSGASSATTQRVIAATDSPEVTALQIIDDWDETDRAKVNIIVGQAGVAANMGTVGATVQRVIPASSDTGAINAVSIGTGSTSVLGSSSTRQGVILSNDSDEDIYIAFGATAVLGRGVMLPPDCSIGVSDFTGAINAICLTGTKTLTYQTFS